MEPRRSAHPLAIRIVRVYPSDCLSMPLVDPILRSFLAALASTGPSVLRPIVKCGRLDGLPGGSSRPEATRGAAPPTRRTEAARARTSLGAARQRGHRGFRRVTDAPESKDKEKEKEKDKVRYARSRARRDLASRRVTRVTRVTRVRATPGPRKSARAPRALAAAPTGPLLERRNSRPVVGRRRGGGWKC